MLGYLDIVVLNHAVQQYRRWTADSDLTEVPRYFDVNTISFINIATLLLPELDKTNGSIIVISSFGGVIGFPRVALYSANKHALHGFFDSLRQDLALGSYKGISVTLFILGVIDTESAARLSKGTPVESVARSPVDECALAIVKGGAARKRQVYFPSYLSIVETLHYFFPRFVESVFHIVLYEKPLNDLLVF